MESKIIGRENEILIFERLLKSNAAKFVAIYGRRRVGKTFLVREYFKNHIKFSFTGSFEEKTDVQLKNFFREYLQRTNGKKETTEPQDWNTAFNYLADYLKNLKSNRKIVVFIDELPWLDRPKSGFVKALEYFWNQHGSKMDNVLLIVCGSAASWMQKKLLKAKGGLYNRITNRIKLKPFNLYETELFLKRKQIKLSRYQIVLIYMVMGGIPFYLDILTKGKSAEQLIDAHCFQPNSLLSDEYNQLYYSLFKHAENHMAIIEALASKPNGMTRKELLKATKLNDGGTFARAINDLLESDFVQIYNSFQKKKKDAIYKLTDFYSLFYLKFIKGNIKNTKHNWQKIASQQSFKAWSGYAFENICMMHTTQILNKLGISGIYSSISSWKFQGNDELPGAQIDMIIDRNDNMINLCEAKFTSKEFIINKAYNDKLRQRRNVFENVTKSKKAIVTTLLTTYPAHQNKYYHEEIDSEVNMNDLFTPNEL
jgi:AAA+ ATPase superfamily predicted ATPase